MGNLRPTEFKALTKLLISLAASFYEVNTSQNNFDCSDQCQREATQLDFFNIQIKIIITKKKFPMRQVQK